VQSDSHLNLVDRFIVVIGFDLAIETVLRAIVGSIDSSKTPADGFQGLIQQCDTLLQAKGQKVIPDKANIQFIHSIRNDVQHKAKYPNESDVSDCRTYTRDFLRKVVLEVWGIDFEKVSLVDLIQNNKIKQYLQDAEENLSNDKYEDAMRQASAGLGWTLYCVEASLVGKMPSFTGGIQLLDSWGKPKPDSDTRSALKTIERMQRTLPHCALGMDITEYMRYEEYVGQVFFSMDGTSHNLNMIQNPERSIAEYVVSYSINTVVKIEGIVGDIEAPFGIEYWRY